MGPLAPVHQCARVVCCVVSAVCWATWLLSTAAPARCVALWVRCPRPPGSCSSVCPLGVLCCMCGVLGHLAPVHRCALCCVCGVLGHLVHVHRCARSVRCFACAGSWATWLLFTGAPTRCVALLVRCPGPLGSCSPVCPLGGLLCVCGVLGHLAPFHQCARPVRCFVGAVSWATWLLFTDVCAPCVVLRVRWDGPLGFSSAVCPLGALLCVCGVLGRLAPVHRCARVVSCVVSAVCWAIWLLFTSAPARCVALLVRCRGPLGSSSPVCVVLRVRCPGPLGPCSPVCVVLRVRCPGRLGSCTPVCPLGVLLCVCGALGHLAPVHRLPAPSVAVLVRCHGPLGSCSPVFSLRVLCCVCGVLGHLAPVHRCARSVLCFARAVSWATWLLFTGVPAWCVVLRVRCPGPLGSYSPVCPLCALCRVCGVLGLLAPVHRCARWVCCVACTVSWTTWLLFTGVLARCAVGCAVSWVSWLLFTSVLARCVVLWVACAGGRWGVLTCPSGRRLFVAGRGWVPSGRALVHPDGGCSVSGRD